MGKRSRRIADRRRRQQFLERLGRHKSLMDGLKLEFCRTAARFADFGSYELFGAPSAVAWMVRNLNMTEADAAECIAMGRYLADPDVLRPLTTRPSRSSA
ncbi:MAG TPA: hypothetical protein VG426_15060 [Candidatus Dormibacteraeota bacterium]|jgi:hypothetical protein|nr:hypothetical protein [Candidatus Dormibacteraeota bacterium]